MKRRYQMDREKAVRRFESQAARGDQEGPTPFTAEADRRRFAGRRRRAYASSRARADAASSWRRKSANSPANVANDERTKKAIAGVVNKASWSSMGRRSKSIGRACAPPTATNKRSAATSCSAATNRSMKRSGTSSCWVSQRATTAK